MRVLLLCQNPRPASRLAPHLTDFRFSPFPVHDGWDLVINWGCTEGDGLSSYQLNPPEAVRICEDSQQVSAFLKLNRIASGVRKASSRTAHLAGRYRVDLFDLNTLAVSRWDGSRFRLFPWKGHPRVGVIRQLARRALYALGLHFGAVEVGISPSDRTPYVLRVDPAPALSPYLARQYAAAFKLYAQQMLARQQRRALREWSFDGTAEDEVVLGCDPEFVLRRIKTGKLVPASRFFTRSGMVGVDRVAFRRDGVRHHPLAELRPKPSPSPHQLVENLREAMLKAAWAVRGRGIRFQAGSLGSKGYPIGGHIHFSNLRPSTRLLRALDSYLAVPLLLLEDPTTARARRPKYGTLGDFRMQKHGGFEYRTPSSWIFSPEFALAVLCLSKIVATDYDLLNRSVLQSLEAQRDFYKARKEGFRKAFPLLWKDLTATPTYRRYTADLELLKRLIDEERRWNEKIDIKKRWLRT